MDFTRFEDLLRGWHDGDSSPADLAEFESLLKSDPLYRKEFVHSILLEAGLHRHYAAAKAVEVAVAPIRPAWKTRRWEAAAALIVLAVSLVAVGRLLTRGETSAHRVLSGDVRTLGAPANLLRDGQSFEVRGLAPATVQLKDGTRAILDAGSAGSIPAEGSSFQLTKGSASFAVGRSFRVHTPAGTLDASAGQFWILLRPAGRKLPGELARRPELVVETARGSVDVDAWEVRASVGAGQRRIFGAPVPGGKTDWARLLDGTRLTLSAAIARAAAAGPGVPVYAELEDEDGRVVYSIGLAVADKVREILIDAKTGDVVGREDEDGDLSRSAAALPMPLQGLLDKVLESAAGRAVEAEVELKGGRLLLEVKVFGPDGLVEIKADETGAILTSREKN